jgi:hypothetical protein
VLGLDSRIDEFERIQNKFALKDLLNIRKDEIVCVAAKRCFQVHRQFISQFGCAGFHDNYDIVRAREAVAGGTTVVCGELAGERFGRPAVPSEPSTSAVKECINKNQRSHAKKQIFIKHNMPKEGHLVANRKSKSARNDVSNKKD